MKPAPPKIGPPARLLTRTWLVSLSSRAFHAPSDTEHPSVWISLYLQDLPQWLRQLAEKELEICLCYDYPLDGVSQKAEAYRHYRDLYRAYRGLRGFARYAQLGPSSLRYYSNDFHQLMDRIFGGHILGFTCDKCGASGGATDLIPGSWTDGEGRGYRWGDTLSCPGCGTRAAARLAGVTD